MAELQQRGAYGVARKLAICATLKSKQEAMQGKELLRRFGWGAQLPAPIEAPKMAPRQALHAGVAKQWARKNAKALPPQSEQACRVQ